MAQDLITNMFQNKYLRLCKKDAIELKMKPPPCLPLLIPSMQMIVIKMFIC